MSKTIDKIQKFWWKEGHFNENQRDFFIEILSKVNPRNVLEIGFASGRSCCTILCSSNPEKIISVDINLDYMGARENSDFLISNFKNLKIIEGDSKNILNEEFFKSEFPDGLDFIFIDGDHSYEGAYLDIRNTFNFLNPGGIMIIDDFKSGPPDGCSIPDVDRAVEDFSKQFLIEYISWNNSGKGFAIFTKE